MTSSSLPFDKLAGPKFPEDTKNRDTGRCISRMEVLKSDRAAAELSESRVNRKLAGN